ncbi:MAG TPA: hypothetical protein VF142_06660, partial [Longimicrobium sp.]
RQPDQVEMLVHPDGVHVPELDRLYTQRVTHDPRDLDGARRLADGGGRIRLGVFFQDETRPRYDEMRRLPRHTAADKVNLLERELDRHAL